MTLTFVMMSVVAFAQQTEQKALPSLKKQPTLKQQILQAKREGKQLNKETLAQFKYNKPAASQIIKKQQRNLTLPVKKLDVAAAKAKASVLQIPGKDEWYICYHRINKNYVRHEPGIHREVCINKMTFDKQGRIVPVKPTLNFEK